VRNNEMVIFVNIAAIIILLLALHMFRACWHYPSASKVSAKMK